MIAVNLNCIDCVEPGNDCYLSVFSSFFSALFSSHISQVLMHAASVSDTVCLPMHFSRIFNKEWGTWWWLSFPADKKVVQHEKRTHHCSFQLLFH